MKTKPSIWVTIGERWGTREMISRVLSEYEIGGIRINIGRDTFRFARDVIAEVANQGYSPSKIYLDVANSKPRIHLYGTREMHVIRGQQFRISLRDGMAGDGYVPSPLFFEALDLEDVLTVGDDTIAFTVEEVTDAQATLTSIYEGNLGHLAGLGIVGKETSRFQISDNEAAEIDEILSKFSIGLILSFVQTVRDVDWGRARFPNAYSVMPKIETREAYANIESFTRNCEQILIGRGDLGLALGIERIGLAQQRIFRVARESKCGVVVAAGTLESLKWNSAPSRAEIIDITNSYVEGAAGIMLTSETGGTSDPLPTIGYLDRTLNYLVQAEREQVSI